MTLNLRFSLAMALAAALAASPAVAQKGNGHGNGHGNHGRGGQVHENRERDRDRDDDHRQRSDRERRATGEWRRDSRYVYSPSGRRVPRGWCQGVGNPHNTRANCGRYYTGGNRTQSGRVYDSRRTGGVYTGGRNTSTSSSYEAAHQRYHDTTLRQCRQRVNERPLDRAWQVRIVEECNRQHDAWHQRNGGR